MKRIPRSAQVSKSLRRAAAAVKLAWRGVNLEAATAMAKGNYPGAEELAARGRQVKEFLASVESLASVWRSLDKAGSAGKGREKGTRLPQWEYYQPVLQALVELGGEARRAQIEAAVERTLGGRLQPVDRAVSSSGLERWRVMVFRSRRLMRLEGWLEDSGSPVWRITADGRRAAAAKPSATAPKNKQEHN